VGQVAAPAGNGRGLIRQLLASPGADADLLHFLAVLAVPVFVAGVVAFIALAIAHACRPALAFDARAFGVGFFWIASGVAALIGAVGGSFRFRGEAADAGVSAPAQVLPGQGGEGG
jgi:hypothetical protein